MNYQKGYIYFDRIISEHINDYHDQDFIKALKELDSDKNKSISDENHILNDIASSEHLSDKFAAYFLLIILENTYKNLTFLDFGSRDAE